MLLGSMDDRKDDLVVLCHYLLAPPYGKIDEVAGYGPEVNIGGGGRGRRRGLLTID